MPRFRFASIAVAAAAVASAFACGSKARDGESQTSSGSTTASARDAGSAAAMAAGDAGVLADARAVAAGPVPAGSSQLVVVTTADWTSPRATLRRFRRTGARWSAPIGEPIPVMLGAAGLGWGVGLHPPSPVAGPEKMEGDQRSPAGVFLIGDAFGYSASPPSDTKLPYTPAKGTHLCIDDPGSGSYNRIIDSRGVEVDWSSAERMRRGDDLYRWVIEVDHNHLASDEAPLRGRGSCIFFHVWRRPDGASVGCAMMSRPAMEGLMQWLEPASQPVVVLLPEPVYALLQQRWQLPALE